MKDILTSFTEIINGVAVLIDPDKMNSHQKLLSLIEKCEEALIDYFFIGGSTVKKTDFENVMNFIKSNTSIPVVIFPGSNNQISEQANAMLYLSLLSGRNPDYLIGLHVQSVEEIHQKNIEVIPTAYLLIDGGTNSSVAYVSQTTPIPRTQVSIARKTSMAGKFQGKKVIYLDAGSGARFSVPPVMIEEVSKLELPLIIGGGIKSINQINQIHKSGAHIVVIGNHIENDLSFLEEIKKYKTRSKNQEVL
ncbi:MAG: geranylgeranylglyceryl/heptaprenylglyceryl phosphate synthase [Crocinitomicaceae bacterium]|nr:geranylgeranylglyceryl/heptaprenylglyceryl phosphate synthase [Crocinitomicaceae bacterium]